jgi:FkbM family methyltransferase
MNIETLTISFEGKPVPFAYRANSEGDRGVIRQVFENNDYGFQHWAQGKALMAFHERESKLRPSLVIDAGANIGASAVYFLNMLQNVFVFSIEPQLSNWRLLELNTEAYPNKINFHGAIANTEGEVMVVDPGYSDWGFRTSAVPENGTAGDAHIVESLSPRSILAEPSLALATPLILKIDIEGAERELFEGDVEWLGRFALVIIELHDWMLPFQGSSSNFLKAVSQFNFDFVYRNENIFLFNRDMLAPAA